MHVIAQQPKGGQIPIPDDLSAADPIASPTPSTSTGYRFTVTHDQSGEFGVVAVTLVETTGLIHADLSVGANVTFAAALRAAGQFPRELLLNSELLIHTGRGLQANLALEIPEKPKKPAKTQSSAQTAGEAANPAAQPWSATLPEQVRAGAELLTSAAAAMPLSTIEATFKRKDQWKRGLPRILETLEALGRARREGDGTIRAHVAAADGHKAIETMPRVATGKRRGHEALAGPGRHPRSAHLHLAMQAELA